MVHTFRLAGQALSYSIACDGVRISQNTKLSCPRHLSVYFEHQGPRIGAVLTKMDIDGMRVQGHITLNDADGDQEQVLRFINLGMVRALSVRYRPGQREDPYWARDVRECAITEVSICRAGKDPLGRITTLDFVRAQ